MVTFKFSRKWTTKNLRLLLLLCILLFFRHLWEPWKVYRTGVGPGVGKLERIGGVLPVHTMFYGGSFRIHHLTVPLRLPPRDLLSHTWCPWDLHLSRSPFFVLPHNSTRVVIQIPDFGPSSRFICLVSPVLRSDGFGQGNCGGLEISPFSNTFSFRKPSNLRHYGPQIPREDAGDSYIWFFSS